MDFLILYNKYQIYMIKIFNDFFLCLQSNESIQENLVKHNKNSRRNKKIPKIDLQVEYLWQISRGKIEIKTKEEIQLLKEAVEDDEKKGVRYQEITAINSLDNGLNKIDIIKNLNTKNCFDFEYQPLHGDCFSIHHNKKHLRGYFLVVFFIDKWIDFDLDKFTSKEHKIILEGNLKFI